MFTRAKKYNKLVRDKVPEIIKANGGIPKVHVITNDKEYIKALIEKLKEELKEFFLAKNASEAIFEGGDLFEVLIAILKVRGISLEQAESARINKLGLRGGFERRIFLESVAKAP